MKAIILGVMLAAMPLAAHADTSKAEDVKAIQQIEQKLCSAIKAMDTKAIMSLYVTDDNPGTKLHVYDMMIPRQYTDAASFTKNWDGFFKKHAKSIDVCEDDEMVVHASGDLATAHFVQHAELTDKAEKKITAVTRLTHIFQRIGGKWLIVHEHGSYPIDWQTGMADMLSKP